MMRLEELDHARRVAECAPRVILAAGMNVVRDGNIARALFDHRELPAASVIRYVECGTSWRQ